MRILFFDIDGTLIRSGGAGKMAMEAGFCQAFGIDEVRDRIPYSGRTDPGIARDMLTQHGIEPTPTNIDRLRAAYLAQLPNALRNRQGEVLPGIVDALKRPRNGTAVGILTGNIRAGAEIKLRHFGLWDHFEFGGFADGLAERDDVARHAFHEAEMHTGVRLNPKDVWVIGDTPLDVQCARAIGANAVIVATGWHSLAELQASKPDHLLPDFSHAGDLLTQWGFL